MQTRSRERKRWPEHSAFSHGRSGLGEGRGARWQHLSGWASAGKRERREVRSASQTSTRNSSSFLGPASDPFDCPTAPSPTLRLPSCALPSSHVGPPSSAQTGAKHFSPQGLCTGCCCRLDPFLPSPRCWACLTTPHPSGLFTGLRGSLPALGVTFFCHSTLCLASQLSSDVSFHHCLF